jgi:hypothetical protein
VVELHRRRGGQVAAAGEAGDIRHVGLGTGGDEVVRGLDAAPVDLKRWPFDEPGAAADDLEAILSREVHILLLAHRLDDLALAGDERREVDRLSLRGDAWKSPLACPPAGLGRGKQRLRRDTADVHAGPANGVAFDHHDAQVSASSGDGGRERATAGTDDGQVVVVGIGVGAVAGARLDDALAPVPGPVQRSRDLRRRRAIGIERRASGAPVNVDIASPRRFERARHVLRTRRARHTGDPQLRPHRQHTPPSMRRQAATCSALSESSARTSVSSCVTRSSATR